MKNLSLAWVSRRVDGPGSRRRRQRGGQAPIIVGGRGTGEFAGGGVNVEGLDPAWWTASLYVTAPDNVWALDARDGPQALALLLEDARRHAHRQPRLRHVATAISTSRRPTTISSRSMRARARSDGTSRSPISTSSTSRRRRRSSSTTTCSSAPATISTCRDSCSRSIRRPARCSGSSTPCR